MLSFCQCPESLESQNSSFTKYLLFKIKRLREAPHWDSFLLQMDIVSATYSVFKGLSADGLILPELVSNSYVMIRKIGKGTRKAKGNLELQVTVQPPKILDLMLQSSR